MLATIYLMGCGHGNHRTAVPMNIWETGGSNCREVYLIKKHEQIQIFLEHCGILEKNKEKADAILSIIVKDSQGISSTPTGGEISALKEAIDIIRSLVIPSELLVESAFQLSNIQISNQGAIERQYGRFNLTSAQYLYSEFRRIPEEKLLKQETKYPQLLSNFLFVVFGTFRYCSGLNFRLGFSRDKNAIRFLKALFQQLCIIKDNLGVESSLNSCKFRTKNEYAEVDSLQALENVQDRKGIPKKISKFSSIMLKFILETKEKSLFVGNALHVAIDYLGTFTPLATTRNISAQIISNESRFRTPKAHAYSSSIIFLESPQENSISDMIFSSLFAFHEAGNYKAQLVGIHYCCKYNILTRLSTPVIFHMLRALYNHNEIIKGYLQCIEYDLRNIFEGKIHDSIELILIKVFGKIAELPINKNLVYFIRRGDLLEESFFQILRKCQSSIPSFMKIVIGLRKGKSSKRASCLLSKSTKLSLIKGGFIPRLVYYFVEHNIDDQGSPTSRPKLLSRMIEYIEDDVERLKEVIKTLNTNEKVCSRELELKFQSDSFVGKLRQKEKFRKILEEMPKEDREKMEIIIGVFIEVRSPLSLSLLKLIHSSMDIEVLLKKYSEFFKFGEDTGTIRLKHKRIFKEICKTVYMKTCWNCFETGNHLEEYFRINIVRHFSKIMKKEEIITNTQFCFPEWIFSQICYFQSFEPVYKELSLLQNGRKDTQLIRLKNHLYLIENTFRDTIMKENFTEFLTQLRGRLMNENYPLLKSIFNSIPYIDVPFLNPTHPILKDNNNFEFIERMDSNIVTACIAEDYLIAASVYGMIYVYRFPYYNLATKCLVNSGITTLSYTREGQFLLGARDGTVSLWEINEGSVKPLKAVESNDEGATRIVVQDNVYFSSGVDSMIYRGKLNPFENEKRGHIGKYFITSLTFKKNQIDKVGCLYAGCSSGTVLIFDFNLKLIKKSDQFEQSIVSLLPMPSRVLVITSDCEVHSIDPDTKSINKESSVFHLSNDQLFKALNFITLNIFVCIERRTVRFYKQSSYQMLEEWLYFFDWDIIFAEKSRDEKHLILTDKGSHIVVLTMEKLVYQKTALGIPAHRRDYNISFILSSEEYLLTVSTERELKMWLKNSLKCLKKYSLEEIATDLITAVSLDEKDPSMLYIGCKDSTIFFIDVPSALAIESLADQHSRIT